MINRMRSKRRIAAPYVSYRLSDYAGRILPPAGKVARGVLHLADGGAHAAFRFFGTAFGLETAIAGRLADGLFDRTGDLLCGTGNPLLVHNQTPDKIVVLAEQQVRAVGSVKTKALGGLRLGEPARVARRRPARQA